MLVRASIGVVCGGGEGVSTCVGTTRTGVQPVGAGRLLNGQPEETRRQLKEEKVRRVDLLIEPE